MCVHRFTKYEHIPTKNMSTIRESGWRFGPCDSESNPNGRHYVTTIPPQEGKQPAVRSAIRGKAKRSNRGRGTDAQPPERLWAGTDK